jgi:hypothetical protein
LDYFDNPPVYDSISCFSSEFLRNVVFFRVSFGQQRFTGKSEGKTSWRVNSNDFESLIFFLNWNVCRSLYDNKIAVIENGTLDGLSGLQTL